jgi:hypothetical protein
MADTQRHKSREAKPVPGAPAAARKTASSVISVIEPWRRANVPSSEVQNSGAAAPATLPFHVYCGFRWEQAPRPVYAAAIVPVYLLFSALLSFRAQWKRRLVEAAVVYLLGFAIFGLCRWLEWWQMGLARDS